MTRRVSPDLAAFVRARAGGRCEYCHAPPQITGQVFHIDHIRPRSQGGQDNTDNLCLACAHCNFAKGSRTEARDPIDGIVVRIFNPRTDRWERNFSWSADFTLIIGNTSMGRATVVCLNLNAETFKLARPYWRVAGLIPRPQFSM